MSRHTEHSSFREKLVEHLFAGELLKLSWQDGDCSLEIAKPEVDNAGYDLIAEAHGVVRHIQLKSTYHGGRAATQKIHMRLSGKPSGCMLWVYFNENTLELGPFYFFGGKPGEPLPALEGFKTARHTKGDQDGYKGERPNLKVVPKGKFRELKSMRAVYRALFGVPAQVNLLQA
jgi:hypothetical protein